MVEHKCHKCNKIFDKKSSLNYHLNRIYPCDRKDAKFKCESCNKKFNRRDSLNKHIKKVHPEITDKGKNKYENNGDNNGINNGIYGNNNKNNVIVNNQYFLLPFGTYQLDDDLTTTEKVAIFTSKYSIIEMIIFKTHLNPKLEKYHNCGITDLHSGYGLINDGDDWKCWPVKDIMTVLIDNGQQNSLKIYNKIKHFFQDDTREEIENDLNSDKHLLYPRHNFFDIDVKAKKKLISSLKSNLYNQRNLVQTAIKNSGKKIPEINKNAGDTNLNYLKEGITIADIDDYLKKEKEKETQNINCLSIKKEVAMYILERLEKISNVKYDEFVNEINKIDDIEHINLIIRILNKSYCYATNINNVNITDEINNQIKLNKFIFV